MNIVLFSFTRKASELSRRLHQFFTEQGITCRALCTAKYASEPELLPLTKPLGEHVQEQFHTDCALIFISACGIAVRSIAPFIKSKTTDPCVLVIDETGRYVISLLSGHIGGGNALAKRTADFLHAEPIITTATDLNQKFSVDTFAKESGYALSDLTLAKEISAALLDNLPVGVHTNIADSTILPRLAEHGFSFGSSDHTTAIANNPAEHECCLVPTNTQTTGIQQKPQLGFCISAFSKPAPFSKTLFLIPKQVVLGIGCRRRTSYEALKSFVETILRQYEIHTQAVAAITSIDLKQKEPCLIQLAEHYAVPFLTYTAKELEQVPGTFSSSAFVKTVTGVGNVCERASLAYSRAEHLFIPKTAGQGITLAASLLPDTQLTDIPACNYKGDHQ